MDWNLFIQIKNKGGKIMKTNNCRVIFTCTNQTDCEFFEGENWKCIWYLNFDSPCEGHCLNSNARMRATEDALLKKFK